MNSRPLPRYVRSEEIMPRVFSHTLVSQASCRQRWQWTAKGYLEKLDRAGLDKLARLTLEEDPSRLGL